MQIERKCDQIMTNKAPLQLFLGSVRFASTSLVYEWVSCFNRTADYNEK